MLKFHPNNYFYKNYPTFKASNLSNNSNFLKIFKRYMFSTRRISAQTSSFFLNKAKKLQLGQNNYFCTQKNYKGFMSKKSKHVHIIEDFDQEKEKNRSIAYVTHDKKHPLSLPISPHDFDGNELIELIVPENKDLETIDLSFHEKADQFIQDKKENILFAMENKEDIQKKKGAAIDCLRKKGDAAFRKIYQKKI